MVRRCVVLPLLLSSLPVLAKPPRLTLFVAVDSLGADLFQKSRPRLKSGFARLLNEGAYFPSVRYETAECVTAEGHTTLVTGTWPWRHGIVGNRLMNRATGKLEPAFFEPAHPVLETPRVPEDGSPNALLAETLSDRLRAATGLKGKSIAVSGKGRSAVPMAGRLGDAWWFHEQVGKFVTGTWYRKEFPGWVKAFNDRHVPDAYHGKSWELLEPAKAYAGEDDRPFESDRFAMGRVFPHPLGGGMPSPGPQSWGALASSPMMNEVLVEFAKAAIEGEQLGKDDVPDLLSVSFSSLDRTYHLYGPTSWEVQDQLVRLDRSLGELIAAAERAAGRGNVLVIVASDHGGANIPEEWAALGLGGARVSPSAIQKGLNDELDKRFGTSGLVAAIEEVDVYLDQKGIDAKGLDGASVRRAVAAALMRNPDVQIAVARDDLEGVQASGLGELLRHSFHRERSGDVLFVVRPFRVLEDEKDGTSHGTPWSYDAEIPVLLFGRGVKPGVYPGPATAIDVAPTVALLMELGAPAMCEGKALRDVLLLSK